MLNIRIYSDFHLDHYPVAALWYPPELTDDKETILILAGDLWVGYRWIKHADNSWIKDVASRFKEILVVLGNHDYWPQGRLSIVGGATKCNALLLDQGIMNVHVLDTATFAMDDVLFVGATLWTDMHNADAFAMHNMSTAMRYDGKIAYDTTGRFTRFSSNKWIQTHREHRAYIELIAKQNKDKKIAVLTHHLPLKLMSTPIQDDASYDAYYYSELDTLILNNENIVLWACGHSHTQLDQMFGNCRLYMNAVGYKGNEINNAKHEVIEL